MHRTYTNNKPTVAAAFRARSKQMQPFARSKPYTEVRDTHARYYAMNEGGGRKFGKAVFKDDEGRRYRLGDKQPGGLQRLVVRLPKGVGWVAAGRVLDLYPIKDRTVRLMPTVAYVGVTNDMLRRTGYVDVRGWFWEQQHEEEGQT